MAISNRGVSRRGFLKGAAALTAGAAAYPALQGLGLLGEQGRTYAQPGTGGYGDLMPARDLRDGVEHISLPSGFRYRSFSVSKAGQTMSDGNPVPIALDGMAGWDMGDGSVRLVRNHEDRNGPGNGTVPTNGLSYDQSAGGGCTTLVIDARSRELISDFVSQNGSIVNCAGGVTPWMSWITCEETTAGPPQGWDEQHGYCWDVPVGGNGPADASGPYTALGRFAHEAIACSPDGVVYETEDSGDTSGFYRFTPDSFGNLNSGTLEMLKIVGEDEYLTYTPHSPGDQFDVEWVPIADPEPPGQGGNDVFDQGAALGAAHFSRLEGCWYGHGSIFFVSTSGGGAGNGQVWQYNINDETLTLIFESPDSDVLDNPDNLTVSPSGNLLLCEDGGSPDQFLRGLTQDGAIFDFAANLEDNTEWAGATFVKHGPGRPNPANTTLFVNRQGGTSGSAAPGQPQGMTFAIWGPWARGAL